jgi:NADH-quinone oxidoreductase subunit N
MPLLIISCGAVLTLLFGAIFPGRVSVMIAVAALLGAALWSLQTPPVLSAPQLGIVATPLARLFTVVFCLLGAAVLLISVNYNEWRSISGEEYPATVLFAVFGMTALAAATNLLILFLGLEAMTFGFYILVAIDLKNGRSGEAGLKYLLLGAVSAAFLAFGIALLYFSSGSLQTADAVRIGAGDLIALCGWGFILIGTAFKLSLVPAHLWTPDIYQGAPAPVVAFLSGGSKSAAILFAVMLLSAFGDLGSLRMPLLFLVLLSMVLGNLAALMQKSIRRMLAYSSIAQMGYVGLALLSGRSGGFSAALFYALAYALMSLAAFGAVAIFERSGLTDQLEDYKGGGGAHPFAAAVLALSMFALAGIPPTAGFTGKFMIFASALRGGETSLAIIGILTAAASAFYYLRVVVNLYMHRPGREVPAETGWPEILVLSAAAFLILVAGLFPTLFMP